MFISEQHIAQNRVRKSRKSVFEVGMPLAKPRNVKRKFTYKEFTLVLGVFVAMIIAITLWAHDRYDPHTNIRSFPTTEKVLPALNSLVKFVFFRF